MLHEVDGLFDGDLPDGGIRVECSACSWPTILGPDEQLPKECQCCHRMVCYPVGANW